MIITSQQNPIYRKLRTLLTAKGIKENNQCLIGGAKLTQDYLKRNPSGDFFWVMRSDQKLPEGNFKDTVTLARELYETLDEAGSHHPLLCVRVPEIKPLTDINLTKPAVYCAVGDPANLGAILRSAMAFGVQQIVLLVEASHPFLPKAIRSSSGYALELNYFSGPAARELTSADLVALDMEGPLLWQSDLPANLHFLIGEEGKGVPKSFPGKKLSIPMDPKVESLNAAVAASLMLAEWKRRQNI